MADFTDLDVYFRDLTAQDRFSGVCVGYPGGKVPVFRRIWLRQPGLAGSLHAGDAF